nr:hypothetical protein [Tanacetum cinerariifolium]
MEIDVTIRLEFPILSLLYTHTKSFRQRVKEYQEKDKIGSKPDKNGKRGEAEKSQEQSQLKNTKKRTKSDQNRTKMGSVEKPRKVKSSLIPIFIKKRSNLKKRKRKAQSWKFLVCYDDDDDEEGYNSLNDSIISELPSYSAVTPTELIDSLSMGDKHLDTIPAIELDKFIKSYVENLVSNPSESEGENECDVPAGFTTFFNVLFDDDYDSDSSDDQSLSDEDVRNIISELPSYSAVTPTEPADSLIMEDEHLNTIPAMESDEFIKSCV